MINVSFRVIHELTKWDKNQDPLPITFPISHFQVWLIILFAGVYTPVQKPQVVMVHYCKSHTDGISSLDRFWWFQVCQIKRGKWKWLAKSCNWQTWGMFTNKHGVPISNIVSIKHHVEHFRSWHISAIVKRWISATHFGEMVFSMCIGIHTGVSINGGTAKS